MLGWLAALGSVAIGGPLGPWQGGVADTGLEAPPSCVDEYPYALQALPDAPDLYRLFDPKRSYGTSATVDALSEAAARVAAEYPASDPLLVGDLSRERGGVLPPHRYHHDGRSADVGLFSSNGDQPEWGFEAVGPGQLDIERTWTLIEALLDSGHVEHILLDQGHIDRIVGWLRDEGRMSEDQLARTFPPLSTPRLWAWRSFVRHAPSHRDHLHVRIACE